MLKITYKNLKRGLNMDFFLDKTNIPYETEDYFAIYYDEILKMKNSSYIFIFQ